jgi:transcriptional regulator with PAS, ATPase and Fis domain
MTNVFTSLEYLLGSYPLLISVNTVSFVFKLYIFLTVLLKNIYSGKLSRTHLYLILVLVAALVEDFAWIILLTKNYFFPFASISTHLCILFIVRFAWSFYVMQYLAMSLFIENLIDPTTSLNLRQKIMSIISSLFIIGFLCVAFFNIPNIEPSYHLNKLQENYTLFALFFLIPITLYSVFKKIKKSKIPSILKKQAKIIIQILIIPRFILDFIQFYPFRIIPGWDTSSYAVIGISTIILTSALYYCSRKVIGLRFLNFQNHVQEHHRFNFVDNFKDTLEDLAKATSIYELSHISQAFFKTAFDIPSNRVSLHLRTLNPHETNTGKIILNDTQSQVETFLSNTNPDLEKCINKVKILIYDEIDFNNFYDPNYADETILAFMDSINADIFLPIYKNHSVIGYIIVERYARLNEFYSHIERDEMLVFASYLSNIINLIQNRNLESLIYQEKELKEELYKKHQEINQYKESIHSFLKNHKHKDIGIIFYKNRHFVFANQAAKEIIKININTHLGSPLTKSLKTIAEQVEEYKSPQGCITKNNEGERIVINGVPNLEKNHVIITVYYPDFSDILTNQVNYLKDPTTWDYLLYLETTKPGQLINQLIPGAGEQLLQFKINLLQTALSKKALLLEMAQEDLLPVVELLHHISMRTTLHALTLQGPTKNFEIATKLFGINPIFGAQPEGGKPLLEKLDNNGTLFIQNIEYLDLETQEYLAEYIKYGYYRIFKSNQKMNSSVRIICSTNQNLPLLVQEAAFSQALLDELKKTTVIMPSLLTLPESELYDLAQGIAEQTIQVNDFKNMLDLSIKDKTKIIQSKPTSIHELKSRVQQLLTQKSKENNMSQEVHFEPAYDISDPELAHAARLGKHALRDQRMMTMLWNKFKNQNKIAVFLGVNRSSVNRRCKDYNLL